MDGLAIKAFISVALALVIAGWSVRRKSLNLSGGFAGFVVMAATIMASYRFGALLLAFFFTSSKLTKYGAERKRKSDAEYKEGGQRDWLQVLMNSLIATALALGVAYLTGWNDICLDSEKASLVTGLIGGILGHYACCNGDTWSSEIGVLSSSQPRLITTFKIIIDAAVENSLSRLRTGESRQIARGQIEGDSSERDLWHNQSSCTSPWEFNSGACLICKISLWRAKIVVWFQIHSSCNQALCYPLHLTTICLFFWA